MPENITASVVRIIRYEDMHSTDGFLTDHWIHDTPARIDELAKALTNSTPKRKVVYVFDPAHEVYTRDCVGYAATVYIPYPGGTEAHAGTVPREDFDVFQVLGTLRGRGVYRDSGSNVTVEEFASMIPTAAAALVTRLRAQSCAAV